MNIALALEVVVAGVVLGVAVWTIVARDNYAAVAGFVAYGLLLALIWVRLDAVDVALTEAAISGGLGGVLLLGAAARLRATETVAAERPGIGVHLGAVVLSAGVAVALAAGVLFLPDPAPSLAPAANAAATSLGNPVTNVLMAFRAMDTLLEKVVLLLALVGVWSLASDGVWGGRPGPRHWADPRGVLAFLARLLPPIGAVVGIYLVWTGANHPGGAFQGGTILAAMWLLVIMAGLTDTPPARGRRVRLVLIAGPAVFLAVGLGGLWLGEGFLTYPVAYAKPLIVAIEIANRRFVCATRIWDRLIVSRATRTNRSRTSVSRLRSRTSCKSIHLCLAGEPSSGGPSWNAGRFILPTFRATRNIRFLKRQSLVASIRCLVCRCCAKGSLLV